MTLPNYAYAVFNRRYFKNRLPEIPVVWSYKHYKRERMKKIMGSTWIDAGKATKITLNPEFRTANALWQMTLLHEMVHVEQSYLPAKQAHGRLFQKRMKELALAGAFKKLW